MSAYDELPDALRWFVDEQAAKYAAAHGKTPEEYREELAARVKTTTVRPTHGTGH